MKIDETKYKNDFGIEPEDREKLKAALDQALDIRKFEIELYWKRTAYFWTLITAAFAGYFVILRVWLSEAFAFSNMVSRPED